MDAQFNFLLPILSLNSSPPGLMVAGLTGMFRLKQEIINIREHETFSRVEQYVTSTVRIIVIKMHEYLYYFAILVVYSFCATGLLFC
jgi:hypothetical protein